MPLTTHRPEALPLRSGETAGDPAATARLVNAFLGGRLDESAMAAAVNDKLYRNRARS